MGSTSTCMAPRTIASIVCVGGTRTPTPCWRSSPKPFGSPRVGCAVLLCDLLWRADELRLGTRLRDRHRQAAIVLRPRLPGLRRPARRHHVWVWERHQRRALRKRGRGARRYLQPTLGLGTVAWGAVHPLHLS